MDYRNLGKCSLKVSKICLGAITFGKNTDKAEAKRIVDLAFEAGVNFFDCTDAHGGGLAEEYLGSALSDRRQRSIIIKKDCFYKKEKWYEKL